MTEQNYHICLDHVLKSEGGYINDPDDTGGPTNMGVTLRNFRKYVMPHAEIDDLKKLTREQAATVYRQHYWNAVRANELPNGLDYAMFDFAVNSGPTRAIKFLQRIVGTAQDGRLGPDTMKVATTRDTGYLIDTLCSDRLDWYKRLHNWSKFGKGWNKRIAYVRTYATQMALEQKKTMLERVLPKKLQPKKEAPPPPPKRRKGKSYRTFGWKS